MNEKGGKRKCSALCTLIFLGGTQEKNMVNGEVRPVPSGLKLAFGSTLVFIKLAENELDKNHDVYKLCHTKKKIKTCHNHRPLNRNRIIICQEIPTPRICHELPCLGKIHLAVLMRSSTH